MIWDVILHALSPFGISAANSASFMGGDSLMLFHGDSTDRPGAIYVAKGDKVGEQFHHALIVSIGPCAVTPDNFVNLSGGELARVFNTLAGVKEKLEVLDRTLALCESDQEIVDMAGLRMGIPMFYLDESYRILAMSKTASFDADAEWLHMLENGYLSPKSERLMKESGDLDTLAGLQEPSIYRSTIYPFTSVICNIFSDGRFVSRLNVLCVDGDTSPVVLRCCAIVSEHLKRIWKRSGKVALGSPLQSMLMDLLRGVPLSEGLIADRLTAAPYLDRRLMQVWYVDVEAGNDRQIASYYASLLERLFPDAPLIPLVYREQLVLLTYADDEAGFNSVTVTLAHFFATHRLRCGVSNPFRRLSGLRGFYEQAVAALSLCGSEGPSFYHAVMLEHLLSYIPREQGELCISPDIQRLEEAEKDFSFSLVDTLRVYLSCNCNLNRAAERLFVHKNTLLYRMNHIKGILKCDLNDWDDRLLLSLSFKLMERNGLSEQDDAIAARKDRIPRLATS